MGKQSAYLRFITFFHPTLLSFALPLVKGSQNNLTDTRKRVRSFKMKNTILVWFLLATAASAEPAPKIQFDSTLYDFGTTSLVQSVSGTFTFHNAGDGVLKIQEPKPSCGCTVAKLSSDTLKPG